LKFIVGLIVLLNFALIKVFFDLESQFTVYWAPVVLLDIVLHFYVFIHIVYDYMTFETTKLMWKKELMFSNIYNDKSNELDE
jgi:hypothetical protein